MPRPAATPLTDHGNRVKPLANGDEPYGAKASRGT